VIPKNIIYGLFDPRNGELRYVGKSTTGMRRPNAHCMPSGRKGHTWNARWLAELWTHGLKPEISVLEEHTCSENLPDAEQFFIAYFRSLGCRLTNLTKGGEGALGAVRSRENRIAQSRRLGGRPVFGSDGRRWDTMADCAKELGVTYMSVSAAIHGANPSVAGIAVSFDAVPPEPSLRKVRADAILAAYLNGDNISSIAQREGTTYVAISSMLSGKGVLRGWDTNARERFSVQRGGRPFVDQNGAVYKTQREAARALGLDSGALNRVLHGTLKQTHGYIFRYLDLPSES